MYPTGPFCNTICEFSECSSITLLCMTCNFTQDLSPQTVTGEVAIALSVITYIGLIISVLCLIVFIITYLAVK